jgi:O-antigen ligase
MRLSGIPMWSENAARACAIALGFSIPISVALDNVLLVLIFALWLATLDFRRKSAQIVQNRIALAALGLFALFVIGLAYGTRAPGDGLRYLGKYADLAFIPIFITLFGSDRDRVLAWYAFALSMVVTLALSYLLWAGLLEHGEIIGGDPLVSAVFKRYLTQNILMAFSAFLFVHLGRLASSPAVRYTWFILALLAAINVGLMNPGRTGQVVLAALIVYFAYAMWRWKGSLLMVAVMVVLLATAGINHRLTQTVNEWASWRPGELALTATGERLDFYYTSSTIAWSRPLLGHGTGSFPKVYADQIVGQPITPTGNPHSEYLNIAVQLGGMGLLALIFLFVCQWRFAANLRAAHERDLARGLIVTMAIGCLFNSLLMDHVEGLFFAWASGILFAGLQPTPAADARSS